MIQDMPVIVNDKAMTFFDFMEKYGKDNAECWKVKAVDYFGKVVLMFEYVDKD